MTLGGGGKRRRWRYSVVGGGGLWLSLANKVARRWPRRPARMNKEWRLLWGFWWLPMVREVLGGARGQLEAVSGRKMARKVVEN